MYKIYVVTGEGFVSQVTAMDRTYHKSQEFQRTSPIRATVPWQMFRMI